MTPQGWRNRIVGHGEEAPDQLLANPKNWRLHPKHQQDALAGVLSEVGWVQDVIVNRTTGHVVDGHARVGIAISKREASVPVVYVELTPDEEAKVLATFDPLGAMAGADREQLEDLLKEVRTDDAALRGALRDLADDNGIELGGGGPHQAPEAEVDRAEELREKWDTKPGQLWVIGKHRLLCGDATKAEDVERLMGGATPLLMVTDAPYGVDYEPGWRDGVVGEFGSAAEQRSRVTNDDTPDWSLAWAHFPGDVAYCWLASLHVGAAQQALQSAGFSTRSLIVWVKQHFAISRGHYHWKHEPCWYAVRDGRTAHWVGDRTQTTIWDIPSLNPAGRTEEREPHGTQKPLECMARPIRNHEGDVYDPFLGSGTTMVAAEQLERACFGMEIEPKYVAVTLERLAKMGLEPRLADE